MAGNLGYAAWITGIPPYPFFAAVSDDAIRSMLRVSELEPSEIKRLIEKADSIEEGFPSAKSFSPGM